MKVFVSSVNRGLESVRRQLVDAINAAGDSPVNMEAFGARPEQALPVCLSEVRQADVLVLVVGPRYGSVDPPSGLSYTQLEFQEAMGATIPVLAFEIHPAEPTSQPTDEHADKLAAFRNEVRANCLTKRLDDPFTLPEQAMAALKRFASDWTTKIGQFRVFQDAHDFFASMLNSNSAFNHTHALVGRDATVQELMDFLSSGKFAAVLPGPGGLGKSRLLLELDRRCQPGPIRLVFLGPQFELSAEHLKELPNLPLCVVVDDAHRLASLDAFVQVMAGAKRPSGLKLLFTCRPSGLDRVRYALRSIGEDFLSLFTELKPLEIATEGRSLATASLGDGLGHLAERLAKVADGNPLIITVGGRLIRQGHIPPEQLAHEEDFRTAALNGLLAALPDELDGRVPTRRLLADLAAIGPVRPAKEPVEELLAKHLGTSPSAICSALELLRLEYRLLLRRGHKVRIQPDVLADHLLYRAAVAGQRATGFVDEELHHFGSVYLSNILTNASELEWRCRAAGAGVDVLGQAWRGMCDALPSLTHRERVNLLERLKGAAWFAPDQVWEVLQWAIHNEVAPDDGSQFARVFPVGQADVLARIPPLLTVLAWHLDLAERVAALLWRLGGIDEWPLYSALESPLRILQDILAYDPQKPVSLQERSIAGLDNALADEMEQGRYRDVSQVVSLPLSREPRVMRSDGDKISMGSFALNPDTPRVKALRKRAIEMLARQARCPQPALAVKAIDALGHLFQPPNGLFGRQVSNQEVASWESEVRACIQVLAKIAHDVVYPAVSCRARRTLSESRWVNNWPNLKADLDSAIAALRERPEYWLYDLLRPTHEAIGWREDWQAAEKEHVMWVQEGARETWTRFENVDEVVTRISGAADQLSVAGLDPDAFLLLKSLCDEKPDQVSGLMHAILDKACGTLKRQSAVVLAIWLEHDAQAALAALDRIIAKDDEEEVAAVGSGYLSRWFGHPETRWQEHLRNIARLLKSRHESIRRSAPHSLCWANGICEREALDVVVATDFQGDAKMLDQALGAIDKAHGIDPDLLTPGDIEAILKQIESIRQLSEHSYHVDCFLSIASAKHPAAVIEMLLCRVRKAASLPDGHAREFQPLPYLEFHKGLIGLKESDSYPDLLRRIRDEALGEHWVYTFWIPKLYSLASSSFCSTALDVLREWVLSNASRLIAAAANLTREADHAFVYDHDDFISDCLIAAEKVGTECLRDVRSSFFAVALSGPVCSAVGQAPPQYVEDRNSAAAMKERHQDTPVVAAFFRDLGQRFDHRIREHLARDEEFLDR